MFSFDNDTFTESNANVFQYFLSGKKNESLLTSWSLSSVVVAVAVAVLCGYEFFLSSVVFLDKRAHLVSASVSENTLKSTYNSAPNKWNKNGDCVCDTAQFR